MKKAYLNRTLSLLLACMIAFPAGLTALADDTGTTESAGASDDVVMASDGSRFDTEGRFVVDSAEALMALSDYCSLDSRSDGLRVIVTKDISLVGVDFEPIPYFAGSFDGGEHTISGLVIDDGYSPAGLFSRVAEGASVKDINVRGVVTPSGQRENVGGVVGQNDGLVLRCTFTGNVRAKTAVGGVVGKNGTNGEVYGCSSDGKVTGESMTGGVIGNNAGSAVDCVNRAEVNTDSVDWKLKLDDIEIGSIRDISSSKLLGTMNISTDTGGIAGYSDGMILSCRNEGNIGYSHIGYNVGGIAGRLTGYAANCVNSGKVDGRKDTGGIVGQFEPNVTLNLSEDSISKLKTQLDELSNLVDKAISDASDGSDRILNELSSVNGTVSSTKNSVQKLTNDAGKLADDAVSEVNRLSGVATDAAGRLANISDSFGGVCDAVTGALDSLESAVDSMEEATALGSDALRTLEDASAAATDAVDRISSGAKTMVSGVEDLRNSVSIDEKAMRNALDKISSGAKELSAASEVLADSVQQMIRVFRNAGWTDDAVSDITRLGDEISALGREFSAINKALRDISDAIIVDPEGFRKAIDDITAALDGISSAMKGFSEAADTAKAGMKKIHDGLSKLTPSLGVDKEAANKAMKTISEGFSQYSEAMKAMGKAAGDVLAALPGSWTPEGHEALKSALSDMKSSASDAGGSLIVIADGFGKLAGSLTFTPADIKGGVKLTLEGFDDLRKSIDLLRASNDKLSAALKLLGDGIDELYRSVAIKDTAKIRAALQRISDALNNIAAIITEIGHTVSDMSKTLDRMFIWGDRVAAAVSDVASAVSGLSSGISRIAKGVDELRESVSVDTGLSQKGLDELIAGMKTLLTSDSSIKTAINEIGDACGTLASAGDKLTEASGKLSDSVNGFKKASDLMSGCFDEMNDLFAYLAGVEPIQVKSPGTALKASTNNVYANLTSLTNQLQSLVSEAKSVSGTLAEDLRNINAKFSELSDTVADIFNSTRDASLDNIYSDVSDEEIDSTTDGKLEKNTNEGEVRGDLNVGGIVGSMAIEFDLDPEDDLTGGGSVLNRVYETRAVVRECVNRGEVISKKDNAGGVCGRMDLGVIISSENYGNISSESGDYVGGIAGTSSSKIRGSFAKCTLSGNSYLGGVVGSGNSNNLTGSDLVVTGCRTIVAIGGETPFSGAVAGCDAGTFTDNRYVSDTLRGLDRLSEDGKAEGIAYADLLKEKNIPEDFRSFTLKFTADGETLRTVTFGYGDSFGDDIFPEIPAKDGCLAYWSITDLSDLVFDTNVEAVYVGYTTSVPSTEKRSERPVFFVEGDFDSSDTLDAQPMASDRSGFDRLVDNYIEVIGEFFGSFTRGELPPAYFARELLEQWSVTLPDDGADTHTVRYLIPEGKENLRLYIRESGARSWERLDTTTEGSYMKFSTGESSFELAVATTIAAWWVWVVISALALVVLILIISLAKRSKKRRRDRAEEMRRIGMSGGGFTDGTAGSGTGGGTADKETLI